MAGPRAAAWAGEIRTGHGGIKSPETSVARNWHRSGLCQFQGLFPGVVVLSGVGDGCLEFPKAGHDCRCCGELPALWIRSCSVRMSALSDVIERRCGDG